MSFLLPAIAVLMIGSSGVQAQLKVEPDIAGKWAVRPTLEGDQTQYEGTLEICTNGRAVYVVHLNQLAIYLRAKQQKYGSSVVTLFYLDHTDVGRGFSTFQGFPAKGMLLMRAFWGEENRLDMRNALPQLVQRVRAVTDARDKTIFPAHFYKDTFAAEPDCQ